MTTNNLCAEYAACRTPAQIERVFQRLIKKEPWEDHRDEMIAANVRASEIASAARWGHLYPLRLDKGRGCSQRWRIGDDVFYTGSWGNGAGYRWAMADRDAWLKRKWTEGGVPAGRIDRAVSWLASGYRWRALRELWK